MEIILAVVGTMLTVSLVWVVYKHSQWEEDH